MKTISWSAQTGQSWDPLATILTISIRIGDVEVPVSGVLDTGADVTELQPPLIDQFQVDEDACGFIPITNDHGIIVDTEPVTMATGSLDGYEFRMPVHLRRTVTRPRQVFGRSGLIDHFKISLDPAAATTTFEWSGLSPHNRLSEFETAWTKPRRGRKDHWVGRRI